jgi:hypothetical protein
MSQNIKRRTFLKLAALVISQPLNDVKASDKLTKETLKMRLGDSKIQLTKISGKYTGIVYWRPHGDENIAAEAIEEHIKRYGGTGYIITSKKREIPYEIGGKTHYIDPNRIFIDKKNEKRYDTKKNDPEFNAIESFGKEWLDILKQYPVVVAVHNNENGYEGDGKGGKKTVSINRYKLILPSPVHIDSTEDEDNLFWVTKKSDFDYLKSVEHPNNPNLKGYNVVLEPNLTNPGRFYDRSASVAFSKDRKTHYFNCETQKSTSLTKQLEMLRVINDYLAKSF